MTTANTSATLAELRAHIDEALRIARQLQAWPLAAALDDAVEECDFFVAIARPDD